MRYYQKLVSLLVLVLAASFGVGGCVLLYSDFAVQRGRMATANAAAHAQTCTLLQTPFCGYAAGEVCLARSVPRPQPQRRLCQWPPCARVGGAGLRR